MIRSWRELLDKTNFLLIGAVSKIQGHHGALAVYLDFPIEHTQFYGKFLFIEINAKLVPFFIEEINFNSKKMLVKLEDINNPEGAKEVLRKRVFFDKVDCRNLKLRKSQSEVLEGYLLIDQTLGEIGNILKQTVNEFQIILYVDYNGKEVMVPLADEFIISLDPTSNQLVCKLPDGLFDVND